MSTASVALTRAVIAALTADAVVAALMSGVYDAPPPGALPPYLTVGPDLVSDASTFDVQGREHRVRVVAWDGPLRSARCAAMLAAVEAVVLGLPPMLDGHRLVLMRFLRSTVGAEVPNGPTRGVIEFAARTMALGG